MKSIYKSLNVALVMAFLTTTILCVSACGPSDEERKSAAQATLEAMRNQARTEYSKTSQPPTKLSGLNNIGELRTDIITVDDAVQSTPDGKGKITAKFNDPSDNLKTVAIVFDWSSGESTFEWNK